MAGPVLRSFGVVPPEIVVARTGEATTVAHEVHEIERHDHVVSSSVGAAPLVQLVRNREADHVQDHENSEDRNETLHVVTSLKNWFAATLLPWSSWNYVFSTILKLSILDHRSQEAASAASWECLKNFSSKSFFVEPRH